VTDLRYDEADDPEVEGYDGDQLDLAERLSLRRVAGMSTQLADITEVEYRDLQLERVVLVSVWTSGTQADVDNAVAELKLLAETEGIWAETAGGVTLAVARKLIEEGRIDRDGSTVLCITGNGLKTQEALIDRLPRPVVIKPTLEDFESLVEAGAEAFDQAPLAAAWR